MPFSPTLFGLRVDCISELTDAEALVTEWNALWDACPRAQPFVAPEWVLATWRRFEMRGQRCLVTCRAGDELVGLAALRVVRGEAVRFQSTEVSDYEDVLLGPGYEELALGAVLRFASDAFCGLRLDLDGLEATSALLSFPTPQGFWSCIEASARAPVLELARAAPDAASVVPAGFWRRVLQTRRQAERQHAVATRLSTPETLADDLETLFRLHAARWAAKDQGGVLAHHDTQAFHRETAPALLARGRLWLTLLTFDQCPVAALYVLRGHGRLLYYLGGFEPEAARSSPGRLAIADLIERGIASSARELDFLRGDEPYKFEWGATSRVVHRRRLEPPLKEHCAWVDGSA
jgi:CelD/BcsL family acetyltransferase involved in cellulose biosynthesis